MLRVKVQIYKWKLIVSQQFMKNLKLHFRSIFHSNLYIHIQRRTQGNISGGGGFDKKVLLFEYF